MIADALGVLSLVVVAIWAGVLARTENASRRAVASGSKSESLGTRAQVVLAAGPPAVLALVSTAQLGWGLFDGVPYAVAAGGVAYAFLIALPRIAGRQASRVIPISAWMLTCLGAATAERLYPGTGTSQAQWAVLAIAAFGIAAVLASRWKTTPNRRIGAAVAAAGCVALALPLVPGIGITVNGAPGWIGLGPIIGQPGEIARIAVVAGIGIMFHASGPRIRSGQVSPILTASWPLAVAAAIGGVSNDLGPVLVLSGATAVVLVLARPPLRVLFIMTCSFVAVTMIMFLVIAKLRDRLDQMLHPVTEEGLLQNTGFALRAIANGGWIGTGFNHGNPHAVANVDNDFVLSGIAEERGMIALLAVISIFGAMTVTAWASAQRATSGGPRLVGAGLAAVLSVQSIYVVCAAANLAPVTGMVVPFLSRGGSSVLGMWILLGTIVGLGAHRGAEVQGSADRQLESRLTAAKGAALASWILLIVALLVSPVVRPVPPAPDLNAGPKGNLVLRDGTLAVYQEVLSSGGGEIRHLSETVSERDRPTIQYVDAATGFDACLYRWTESLVLRRGCHPNTVVSSIVPQIQEAARGGFVEGLDGDVVVLDLQTGDILGLYSSASTAGVTEPNSLSAISISSSPGSTFKVVVAAAALATGVSVNTPPREFYTPPGGAGVVRNAGGAVGGGTLKTALAESSNTAFAEIAVRTGIEAIASMAATLSSSSSTEPNAVPVRPIFTGKTASLGPDALARTGFGQQDVRATPLSMAHVAGMLATDGRLPPPRLQAGICDGDTFRPSLVRIPKEAKLDNSITGPIIGGMKASVVGGHSGVLSNAIPPVAAKTGTADNGSGHTYDGWVIAVTPASAPRVAVVVRVWAGEDGESRSGASDAAPIASDVLVAATRYVRDGVKDPCSPER